MNKKDLELYIMDEAQKLLLGIKEGVMKMNLDDKDFIHDILYKYIKDGLERYVKLVNGVLPLIEELDNVKDKADMIVGFKVIIDEIFEGINAMQNAIKEITENKSEFIDAKDILIERLIKMGEIKTAEDFSDFRKTDNGSKLITKMVEEYVKEKKKAVNLGDKDLINKIF